MNSFDGAFFEKYVPEGHKLLHIVHVHPIAILSRIFIFLGLFVIIPSVFYYNSRAIQGIIPFIYFEIYLIIMYVKCIYDIFDWYNDVWMITDKAIVSVEWSLFNINSDTLDHEHIEGMGVEKNSISDMFFKKGDLIVHKFGEESYVLQDAVNPFKAVDIAESVDVSKENDEKLNSEKINEVLQTLTHIVSSKDNSPQIEEEYEKRMKVIEENEKKQKDFYIKKAKKKKGTVDLRD